MASPTDAALVQASLEFPETFAEIFDRHYPRVRAYLERRAGREVAMDLASETFAVAFDRRRRYDPAHEDAAPWLLGISTRLLRRQHRSEVRHLRAVARLDGSGREDDPAPVVESRLDAVALRRPLLAGLAELTPDERDLLVLIAWADLTYAEAAIALDIPLGTVRSRLHRARGRLQRWLVQAAGVQSPAVPSTEVL